MYYLGLSPDFRPKFYNLHTIARQFGVSTSDVESWLQEYHITPDLFRHIDFNVAVAHGRVQEAALVSSKEEVRNLARASFMEMQQSLGGFDESRNRDDIDYDDIWGDKSKPAAPVEEEGEKFIPPPDDDEE